jgi:hypothetical protein
MRNKDRYGGLVYGGNKSAAGGPTQTSPFASLGGSNEAFKQRLGLRQEGMAGLDAFAAAAGGLPSQLEKAQQAGLADLRRRAGQALAGSLGGGGRGVRGGAQSGALREHSMSLGAQEALTRGQQMMDLNQAQQQAALAQFQAASGKAAMGDVHSDFQQQALAAQQNITNILQSKGMSPEQKAQQIEMLAAGAEPQLNSFLKDVAAQVRSGAL